MLSIYYTDVAWALRLRKWLPYVLFVQQPVQTINVTIIKTSKLYITGLLGGDSTSQMASNMESVFNLCRHMKILPWIRDKVRTRMQIQNPTRSIIVSVICPWHWASTIWQRPLCHCVVCLSPSQNKLFTLRLQKKVTIAVNLILAGWQERIGDIVDDGDLFMNAF